MIFYMGKIKNNICILPKKRQKHLSLTRQSTGGLANERQSDIKNLLGRPQKQTHAFLLSRGSDLLILHDYFQGLQGQ